MRVDLREGESAALSMLVNVPRLIPAYSTLQPDLLVPGQRVTFGTSGHRASALNG
jgi:phosphoglucomutase